MSVIKSLWALVQGDPVFMRRVNGWLTIVWIAMIPLSLITGWVRSVVYVSALSLWALVSGHWSAWQAARVEVEQRAEAQAREEADIPGEIVERLLAETELNRSGADEAAPPVAPAGWYERDRQLAYWDGSRWTSAGLARPPKDPAMGRGLSSGREHA